MKSAIASKSEARRFRARRYFARSPSWPFFGQSSVGPEWAGIDGVERRQPVRVLPAVVVGRPSLLAERKQLMDGRWRDLCTQAGDDQRRLRF